MKLILIKFISKIWLEHALRGKCRLHIPLLLIKGLNKTRPVIFLTCVPCFQMILFTGALVELAVLSDAIFNLTSNQLLKLRTARTAWSDSVIRPETSLITESDRRGLIRYLSLFRSFSVNVLP